MVILGLTANVSLAEQRPAEKDQQEQELTAVPGNELRLPPNFKAELLYTVPRQQGSWVSITDDPQGRLIVSDQYGRLYRVDTRSELAVQPIELEIGSAQGLLCAFDSLYAVCHGNNDRPSGLYRLTDTNADDKYDSVQLLRKFDGSGEHGPHAVILGPDKRSLYVCAGNHTDLPRLERSRVPRLWQEDQVIPRLPDAGGHAVGRMAPGGWICKIDPDGKQFELMSSGYRNEYDIAFDGNGELFTYDADMEWDIGLPWYRPTRVCHATSGSEFGWRNGSGKWPDYYPDSLPAAVEIGPGSPTGITFGRGAKFPANYQNTLFISDWSYGIIYAVSLVPRGASFTGTKEPFCTAPALPVTDLVINRKDGAMYFLVGGRRFQSALYRITYTGTESTEPVAAPPIAELAKERRELEKLHFDADPSVRIANVDKAWKSLSHPDRFIRFAARTVIELAPVESWADRALAETDVQARLEALLALVRASESSRYRSEIVRSLGELNWQQLSEMQKLHLLHIYGLIIARMQPLDEPTVTAIYSLTQFYPADSIFLNRELSRVLAAVDAPDVVPKTMALLESSGVQEEQIHYALALHTTKAGWTPELREKYFNWFLDAARLYGGNSFAGYLRNIRELAIQQLSDSEKESLQDVLAKQPESNDPYADLKARPLVRQWTMDDLVSVKDSDLEKCDLENGKKMFAVAQCYKCHRIQGQGGMVGPDLTNAGRRLNLHDLLETIVDPSREVSDQYRATVFQLIDGRLITGRVVNLNGDRYMVQEDMIKPGLLTTVDVKQVEESKPSQVSMMPTALLDTLTRDEILDLLAYMKSTGGTD